MNANTKRSRQGPTLSKGRLCRLTETRVRQSAAGIIAMRHQTKWICPRGTPTPLRRYERRAPGSLPVEEIMQPAESPPFALAGNFATLGTTLLLPAICIPKDDRDATARGLSTAAFNLMFPCLLLVQTMAVVGSGAELSTLAAVAAVAAGQIVCGGVLGAACALAAGLRDAPDDPTQAARFRQAVVASAFGNATTLPLVLGSSLCLTIPALASDTEASGRYIGYLALYQLAWSIALWTLGYGYLIGGGSKGKSEEASDADGAAGNLKDILSRLGSPPSLGSLGGAALGAAGIASVPPQSSAFPVYAAVDLLGQGAQPALAMLLSLSLLGSASEAAAEPAASDEGEAQETVGAISSRLSSAVDLQLLGATLAARGLAVPLVGGALVELAWSQPGLLPEDPVVHLVLLLEAAMPSAQVLVLLAQVQRRQQDDGGAQAASIAKLLLSQYIAILLPLSLWLPVYVERVFPS